MKRFFLIVLVILTFTSCRIRNMNNLKPEDYSKYIRTTDINGYEYSPLSYNMIKGANPYSEYTWTMAQICDYWGNHYSDDQAKLFKAYFSDADIIMSFHGFWFIGIKTKNE